MYFNHKLLREKRESTGLKGAEFARRVPMSQSCYNKCETGRMIPSWDTTVLIARALNMSLNDFVVDTSV